MEQICVQFRDDAWAFVDESLPPAQALVYRAHVTVCQACAELVDQLDREDEQIRSALTVNHPDTFWDAYHTELARKLEHAGAVRTEPL